MAISEVEHLTISQISWWHSKGVAYHKRQQGDDDKPQLPDLAPGEVKHLD